MYRDVFGRQPAVTRLCGVFFRLAIALALFALMLTLTSRAFAAGLDCARATSATERTVCASDDLRQKDGRLAFVYRKLMAALSPQQRDALRTAQIHWLKTRDRCGVNDDCLRKHYASRIATLQTQLVHAIAWRPDNEDWAALAQLRALVDAERRNDRKYPLETVIERLRIKSGMTEFNSEDDKDTYTTHFPKTRPKGVTPDEWKALQASAINVDGQYRSASYTLVDLDGDGRRDLIIDINAGGTSIRYLTSVLRRKGSGFAGNYAPDRVGLDDDTIGDGDDGTGQLYLYSTRARGANQSGDWIRLHGRVYAAYRDGHYGKDDVYLLRPFAVIDKVPKLTVRYRYRLSVPVVQHSGDERTSTTLDDKLHAALMRALRSVSSETPRDDTSAGSNKPLCPVPASVKKDDRMAYYTYGPSGPYEETVGDMAIWVGRECYIGRVIDWFGSGGKDGLFAQLWMSKPDGSDEAKSFEVNGVRTAIATSTSIVKMEVNEDR